MRHSNLFVILLINLSVFIHASSNGLLYQCNAETLEEDNLCVFEAVDSSSTFGPSVVDLDAGETNCRKVVDDAGNDQTLSMRPWMDGIAEVEAAACDITSCQWLYVLSYELLVPLRNAVMFDPESVTTSQAEWTKLTKIFDDCQVKSENEGDGIYSTDEVYEIIQDPSAYHSESSSVHHSMLRWIEEGQADLWCVMTGVNLSDDHCPAVWEKNEMQEGDESTCWQDAYEGLYGEDALELAEAGDQSGSCEVQMMLAGNHMSCLLMIFGLLLLLIFQK